MSASATPPASLTRFSSTELDMLAKTADALSAFLGKPVLAEVVLGEEGTEWVTFGVPLDEKAEADESQVHVQLGGTARACWATAAACRRPTTTPTTACTCGPSRSRSARASASSSWTMMARVRLVGQPGRRAALRADRGS